MHCVDGDGPDFVCFKRRAVHVGRREEGFEDSQCSSARGLCTFVLGLLEDAVA
ncbi:MAG: hypothetical protein JWQ71_506 [Pedosphaera sp.]|nr:hypothetical protein [Pedosphaera sp.]